MKKLPAAPQGEPKGFTLINKFVKVNSSGFTLIELLVAISIVGVIFGIIITSSAAIQRNGRDAQRKSDIRSIQTALQQYYADANFYPDDNSSSGLSLTTSPSITSSIGNPISPATLKTYLQGIPHDPTATTQTPYCYKAYASLTDQTTDCDNSQTKCFYYILSADLENSTPNSYTCNGKTYNFQITPN